MFNQIKALVDLTKEVPDAVGYEIYGPWDFSLPAEIDTSLSQATSERLESLSQLFVEVANYTHKVQKDLRLQYRGNFGFKPQVSFRRREVPVKAELDYENKEIRIAEIPPNESVHVTVFNPSDGFSLEQVLIGDRAVTNAMRKLAARRSPAARKYRVILALVYSVLLVAVVAVCGLLFFTWRQVQDNQKIAAASAGFESCSPYVYKVQSFTDLITMRELAHPYFRKIVLALNWSCPCISGHGLCAM